MNINLSELQVVDNGAITKRLSGLIGEVIEAIETYSLKAVPSSAGVYAPITITPVSFDYYGGVAIKGDGVSEYTFNESCIITGKSLVINGPTPKNDLGVITITPKYNIVDTAVVSSAAKPKIWLGSDDKWILTLDDKNYLYSSVYGTPITGKLNVIGRSFIFSSGRRLAEITIDVILQEGDVLADMTSDEYNARVAEEIQRKIDYFFGVNYATATYNTTEQRYQIVMAEAGDTVLSISASTSEDLSYFGFVSPTYNVGSEALLHPRVVFMTGPLVDMDGYEAEITSPNTISILTPLELRAQDIDMVGQSILLVDTGTINYEVVIYK